MAGLGKLKRKLRIALDRDDERVREVLVNKYGLAAVLKALETIEDTKAQGWARKVERARRREV